MALRPATKAFVEKCSEEIADCCTAIANKTAALGPEHEVAATGIAWCIAQGAAELLFERLQSTEAGRRFLLSIEKAAEKVH